MPRWMRIFRRARCYWRGGWSVRCNRWADSKCCRAVISKAKPGSPNCEFTPVPCSTARGGYSETVRAPFLAFLAYQTSRFSGAIAQKIEFGPAHLAAGDHFDFVDARRMERKNPLDADAVGNLAHGEISAAAAA